MYRKLTLLLCWTLIAVTASSLSAQVRSSTEAVLARADAPFESIDSQNAYPGFSELPSVDFAGSRVQLSGWLQLERGSRDGRLSVKVLIQPGWHIYAHTQPDGGPLRTKIVVPPSPEFQIVGDFQADRDPVIHSDPAFPGVQIEELSDEVTWTAPIRLSEGVDPQLVQIPVAINGQACAAGGACELIRDASVQAKFAGYYQTQAASGSFKDPGGHIKIVGHVEPRVAAPGDSITLVLTANLAPDWHVYRYAPTDPKKISKPTLITLRKAAGWTYGDVKASVEPKEEESGLEEEPILYCHEGTVSWTIPIQVPKNAQPGEYQLAGAIAYQACSSGACDMPTAADFEATAAVSRQAVKGRVPLAFAAGKYAKVAKEAEEIAKIKKKKKKSAVRSSKFDGMPLAAVLGFAFLAGLILNVMPCVLPVIGLKIMSFVHQAGGSRGEILALNLWFSLGLMSVFWILGAAAAFAGHTWGEHFGDLRFLILMIGIVFAFGLSFLGVWEIPIPGFVSSGTMQGAAEREGPIGAYSKGVLSTILATPCAGPFIGSAVGWAVRQPSWVTLLAFTCMGLGMSAPYLLVGAMPRLVNALPKPGAWMEVFKQLMGFVLMGTVVFLFLSVPIEYVIPTLSLLLAVAVACWLVGRIPVTAKSANKTLSWSTGLALIAVTAIIGFVDLSPNQKINWQPFTRVALDQHLESGSTVLVEFTANW